MKDPCRNAGVFNFYKWLSSPINHDKEINLKMNINQTVNAFRNFLNASWDSFTVFNNHLSKEDIEDRINDWYQANWEILVESTVTNHTEFIEPYGFGADCNGDSSRVWLPKANATHRITCCIKPDTICKDLYTGDSINESDIKDMTFVKFTTLAKNKKWHVDMPPFNCVLLMQKSKKADILVNLADIYFDIQNIK
jgi:hypothetical protein